MLWLRHSFECPSSLVECIALVGDILTVMACHEIRRGLSMAFFLTLTWIVILTLVATWITIHHGKICANTLGNHSYQRCHTLLHRDKRVIVHKCDILTSDSTAETKLKKSFFWDTLLHTKKNILINCGYDMCKSFLENCCYHFIGFCCDIRIIFKMSGNSMCCRSSFDSPICRSGLIVWLSMHLLCMNSN